jgi:hypothetical protein
VSYRRNGFKWWVIFIEKYGMPWITANAPTGAKAQEMADLATRLESMVADAVAVIPADYKTEFFESNKTASSAAYKEFIDQQNNEIALAVLGNNLTTEVTGGSYAAAQSHMAVRYDITEGDTRIVEEVFNQLIKLTHGINFGSGEPPVFNLFPEKGVDKTLSERDVNLSGQGVKFSKEYYKRSYNLQDEDFAEPVEVAPVAPVVVPTQEPVPAVA